MHGLVERATFVAQTGRGQHAQRAREDAGLVAQQVAEGVLGNNHVIFGRLANQRRREGIGQHGVVLNVRVLRRHVVGDFAPEAPGDQHVELIHRQHLASPAGRPLEGALDDAADFALAIGQGVHRAALAADEAHLLGLAEVQPADELAQDDHVRPANDLGTQRRPVDQGVVDAHRANVGIKLQALAQPQHPFLRGELGVRVLPLRTADRREQYGVRVEGVLEDLVGTGLAEAVDAVAAERALQLRDANAEACSGVVQHLGAGRHHLRPDAVAGSDDDAPVLHRAGQPVM